MINGVEWTVIFVDPYDERLFMDGDFTIGMTDLDHHEIYIANNLPDQLLWDCIKHEMCHGALFSYGYDLDVPDEECLCQIMEAHGEEIIQLADIIYKEF